MLKGCFHEHKINITVVTSGVTTRNETKVPITLLHFCLDPFLLHRCYPFTLLRCCTKTEGKISVFVRSHWFRAFSKNKPPFLWISTFDSVFENLPFLWRFCADQCEHFNKNGGFSLRFCTKRCSVNGVLSLGAKSESGLEIFTRTIRTKLNKFPKWATSFPGCSYVIR